jgi:mono/diheme cytochrome c family protein
MNRPFNAQSPLHRRGVVLLLAIGLLLIVSCAGPAARVARVTAPVPERHQLGQQLFVTYCARCHGVGAVGTMRGPTFLDRIYEPGHHSDEAFQVAVSNGVRAHHWNFGNMPRITGVTPDQVSEITAYVRWLQREAGVIP